MADVSTITDESALQKMLNDTQDFDERKAIRGRIRELRDGKREQIEADRKRRENMQEDEVQRRQKLAEEDRQRKLQQYQDIAKTPDSVRVDHRFSEDHVLEAKRRADERKASELEQIKDMASTPTSDRLGTAQEQLLRMKHQQADDAKARKMQTYGEIAKKETQVSSETIDTPGGQTTTTTTTTSQKGKDGSTVTTRQQKTSSSVQGFGGVSYGRAAKPQGTRGAMAAFKQMDSSNNPNAGKQPNYLGGGGRGGKAVGVQRSPSTIKQMLLNWCASMVREYKNVNLTNFSGAWANGLAFCALIHHFHPEAFDYSQLDPSKRRYNFTLAFESAEKYADIAPLLDVEDMVRMKTPDWKCVFTYVQSYYRKFRNHECSIHRAPPQSPQ